MLSEMDIKVLKAISEGDSDPLTIAERLGMKVEAVRASADALDEKGLVKVIKSVDEDFSLTEEGRKYAKEGLPERRLLEDIGSGKPMSELKDPSLKIGLGWLRKKGWAVIQGGEIRPSALRKRAKTRRSWRPCCKDQKLDLSWMERLWHCSRAGGWSPPALPSPGDMR